MILRKAILHIDCNAFFVSCERLKAPELLKEAVIVGGRSSESPRSVVTSASYEVREFGVHAGMPLFQAKKLCPHAHVLPNDHDYYQEISEKLYKILKQFSDSVEMASIDEAYVDLTGLDQVWGDDYLSMLHQIERTINTLLQIPVSLGLADNKVTAKIAAGIKKPGITIVPSDETRAFLAHLPVECFPGIGHVFARQLHQAGVKTIGDLQLWSCNEMVHLFGQSGQNLYMAINGYDDREVQAEEGMPQSISYEQTFMQDIIHHDEVTGHLRVMTAQVLRRLRNQHLSTKELRVKLRLQDFTTHTRSYTLPEYAQYDHDIFPIIRNLVQDLLKKIPQSKGIRLVGVSVAQLDTICSHSLFSSERLSRLQSTIDAINNRYNKLSVLHGI
jgi:DNA polymerase-4